ncbi:MULTISPECIES: putative DNA modification/repair radical SAM protein [unclassified Gilliamella]|uniref:putative DNA modification/repair radical SAM protein n=1 Tax=unclassified Gilliamella TaxID=2685620 RepID=UPI00226ACFC8|nr:MULTISPECIES: putative DNA modification/repair radical SAM protein [unclassified Gilliamella]MCX8574607.1 putative DNA modification/repair radical SAM protein [Gilliamella sp. B3831]MCX8576838.1 putative DNA modification/repair radical SAM protein [Gilliamella sp. B3815]MCX8589180.1 putative DNA modification/repair radical SAM protein [Gilliamella sp. B3812]MCX8603754.1 putative DNA modification/repair radical SAM protein [Gilliamella sp. B3823]MCX8606634.1 putative DNA modification/repair 
MNEKMISKLEILAESAKYDISCASSGSSRTNKNKGIGSAHRCGICHSFTADGRCVSLLKIMLTNYCMFDCAYCINRQSNDIPRAGFTPKELADLTIEFYRRNYIEGLFLSSGIVRSPDHTMEKMIRVVKILRNEHGFNGYIHMKAIPGASNDLIVQAGLLVDRMSVNLEIPTEKNLKLLAPDKDHQSIYQPMRHIHQNLLENIEDRKKIKSTPKFVPAGQSTQVIIGATDETDSQILQLTAKLYKRPSMKRVYYSGFIPVNGYDKRLPVLQEVPRVRENRLYQADWLLRFYDFSVDEIVNDQYPDLDLTVDPKLAWAIRNPQFFPVDINRDSYQKILRVPGIGVKSAKLIVLARRHRKLNLEALKRIGVVLKRAQFFIICHEMRKFKLLDSSEEYIRLSLQEKPLLEVKNDNIPQQLVMGW